MSKERAKRKVGLHRLGEFRPTSLDHRTIRRELVERLIASKRLPPEARTRMGDWLGSKCHISVRGPFALEGGERIDDTSEDACAWHRDCSGRAHSIILWASERPTEVRRRDTHYVYRTKPYELIWVDNQLCEHRRPAGPPRWFAVIRFDC